ncbi:purine-nucleoside phosphorylase [Halobacteriovorax marinus]|uniref:Purine-nucleoside phosphorylase n=1 Tax=Halobacteriovorax marinus TaxID=97084 RepID=A0A1Y5FCP0_9BACT|nr:purine-nucleoside phosphorylase [Halobacteriovorax marinus]
MSEKIIVSSCLAGFCCRYDGDHKERLDIVKMVQEGLAIPVCPEQLGGLPTPREPAEVQGDKVITKSGADVSAEYERGANEALKMAQIIGAKKAILKSKSPMCGCDLIYDGSYSGQIKSGDGVFTKLLKLNSIEVESID